MSIVGDIKNLYSDKEKTRALFPTTKIDAVSDDDGTGLNVILESMVHVGDVVSTTETAPINADTLGGRPAEDFATESFVSNKIAEAKLDSSTNIDLSGYATKDDIANISHPVKSINGHTGVVTLTAGDIGAAVASHTHDYAPISHTHDYAPSSHTHNYAGSSSAGGAATSANKLNTNAGGTTQPVYFKDGVPVATTYTLGANVPSGAKFTDTVYTHPSHTAKSSGLYKITVDGNGHVSAATAVAKSDITALGIPSSDTTYSAATTGAAGLMSAADKTKLNGIAAGANAYTHPSYTAKSSGLYKVTVDSSGHVSGTAAVAKADITALGIPAQDTTYSAAGSSLGLVKSGGDVSISGGVITVNDNSHNHTFANISLTSDNYGTSLPSSAPAGKIFFKKV